MDVKQTGEICEVSGQYKVVGTNLETTMVKGKTFPPHSGKSVKYELVDETKHKQ